MFCVKYLLHTASIAGPGARRRRAARPRDRPRDRPLLITARIVGVGLAISLLLAVSGLLNAAASQAVDDLAQLLALEALVLITTVQDTLDRHRLPGEALILEITETGKVPDLDVAAQVLSKIRSLDVRLVDDFGAGFSGLTYLLQLPIDIVKLDRSLTTAANGSRAAAVRNAATTLILGLGLDLIAEGIETQDQVEILAELGCQLGQGFLYAKPRFLADLDFEGRYVGG